jgi:3-methyladenine DNA glycosylase AlkD
MAPAKLKTAPARMTLADAMAELKKAGSEQTRKTYRRHGAPEPMFGVSFATLKGMYKKIKVDHELALALWDTKNFDAMNLALKIVDPAKISSSDLDAWAKTPTARMCGGYVASLAAESPHARAKADAWLAAKEENVRCAGWTLISIMASRDESLPDSWFQSHLSRIESTIRSAPNHERYSMNNAIIGIGGRSPALRKAATAAAKKIGPVEVDHGDTDCETPDALATLDKTWAHATAKKYPSPAAQERDRESMRTRC